MLTDAGTWDALWLTVKVMALSWVLQTPIALALGVFQADRARWRAFFAVLFFLPLPLLLSAVAIGLTWQGFRRRTGRQRPGGWLPASPAGSHPH